MPFTLAGFSSSHASTSMLIVNAVSDPHLTIIGNRLVVPPDLSQIVGAYANGADIARAQLVAPSTRAYINPELSPIDVAGAPGQVDRFLDFRFTPIQLVPNEQLEVDAANAAAAANIDRAFIWLADGSITPVSGDARSTRVTAAITAVAETWVNGALTFADQLPAGRYQVVGARIISATLQAFRLVFPGYPWRPGGVGAVNAQNVEPQELRFGNFGVWGEFEHNAPPTLDIFCSAADAAQSGVLDLIKVR